MTRRQCLAVALPAVVVAGLAGRFLLPGPAGDVAGGVLYTVLVYVLVALIWPRASPWRVAAAAFAFSSAVEVLQWTGAAADLVDLWSPLRLAVGESFVATDFIAYAAGALAAAAVDAGAAATATRSHDRQEARSV